MVRALPILLVLGLLTPVLAFSKIVGVQPSPIPVNGTFIRPTGILFTPFASAASINPASLPSPDSPTALQLAYSPSRGTEAQNIYTGIATASKTFGFGFGYFGSLGDLKTINGGFAGLGFKSDLHYYGFSYRNDDLSSNNLSHFDLAYQYTDPRENLSYGAVVRSVNSQPFVDFGIGYIADRFFNIEFNVSTPKVSQLGNGNFTVIGSSNFGVSSQITVHAQINYLTQSSKIEPVLAANYWLSDNADALLQFSAPNVWSLGFSLFF